ncbi:HprK-related kinase A [Pseudonocardia sp. TMWB2A]
MRHRMSLAVGPSRFRIGSDWAAPIAQLKELYKDYPQGTGKFDDFTVRLEANRPWRRLIRPSVHIRADYMIADALPLALEHGLLAAEMAMNLQMALGWRRHMLLHASAVERDGRALIMTGESGSGKSTLAAMLGERGWRLMGDEFTLVAPDSGQAFAFPRAVSLKNEAIAAMEAEVAADRFGPLLAHTPKGAIRHMRPRTDAVARMGEGATPALILFPRYGFAREIRGLMPSETFMRLTQASTNYVALGEAGFRCLTALVGDVPALAIDYQQGAEAVEMVEQLWAELA